MTMQANKNDHSISGRFGRLSTQRHQYYQKVSHRITEGFDNDESVENSKEIFFRSVFSRLCKEAIEVSRNQTASRIVEKIVQNATKKQLIAFLSALSRDFKSVIKDKFASHVAQTSIEAAFTILYSDDKGDNTESDSDSSSSEDEDEADPSAAGGGLEEQVLCLCGQVRESLETVARDTYASHVLRALIEVLAGVRVDQSVIRSQRSSRHRKDKVGGAAGADEKVVDASRIPDGFTSFLNLVANRVFGAEDFSEMIFHAVSSPVVQTLLLVLKARQPSACKAYCRSMLARAFPSGLDPQKLPALLSDEVGSRTAELVMKQLGSEDMEWLLTTPLKDCLATAALHPKANFPVQTLISALTSQQQFKVVLKALSGDIEAILAAQHVGVLKQLADGCTKWRYGQIRFCKKLLSAFHCWEPEARQGSALMCIVSMQTYEVLYGIDQVKSGDKPSSDDADDDDDDEDKTPTPKPDKDLVITPANLHGSLLVQALLAFSDPQLMVSGILRMTSSQLGVLARDPCGSHVFDALVKSEAVGKKGHEQVVRKLEGEYLEMALSCHGSRVIDAFWAHTSLPLREFIVQQLSKHVDRMQGDKFGRALCAKLAIRLYRQSSQTWRERMGGSAKKKKALQDFLSDALEEVAEPKKKKKKKA